MHIAIIDSGYKDYSFEKQLFESAGFTLDIFPLYKGEKAVKMVFAKEADGILVRHTPIDEEFLTHCKKVKAVVRYGVGYDNIDVDACTRLGVNVANVQGYANHAVSEHALALILSCSRGMWNTNQQLIEKFAAPPVKDLFELHYKTLGIIGLGRIGSELAKKAAPLFKEVIASDPYKPDDHFNKHGVRKVILSELLEISSVISLNCNLTNETRNILDGKAFQNMQERPVIVNTSRGDTIDEKALLKALESERIHSAALDVFRNEPTTTAQEKLIQHPRTICTGHYAWYSESSAIELQKRAALNLYHFLTGEEVEDRLNVIA